MIKSFDKILFFLLFILSVVACTKKSKNVPGSVKYNDKYYPPIHELAEVFSKRDSMLQLAKIALGQDSSNLENWIWYGRRMAYTHKYDKAIEIYSKALMKFPDSPELLRHRGHRYLTTRDFNSAIADLHKASELAKDLPSIIEKDGLPNKLNIPLSNLHFNIYYHLGLAHYFSGDLPKAREVFKKCIYHSNNADLMVATIEWLYKTCCRLNDNTTTEQILKLIRDDFEMIENEAYFDLIKTYKGEKSLSEMRQLIEKPRILSMDQITLAYGIGNQLICKGDTARAKKVFKKIIKSDYWPAFGYIAAETDLDKLEK